MRCAPKFEKRNQRSESLELTAPRPQKHPEAATASTSARRTTNAPRRGEDSEDEGAMSDSWSVAVNPTSGNARDALAQERRCRSDRRHSAFRCIRYDVPMQIARACCITVTSVMLLVACSSTDEAATSPTSSSDGGALGADGGTPPGLVDGASTDATGLGFDAAFDGGTVIACGPVPDAGGIKFTAICELTMPLSGPVATTPDTMGCGQSAADTVMWKAIGGGAKYDVTAVFDTAVPIDVVGVFPLKSLEIVSYADGGGGRWTSALHDCALTITKSDCQPTKAHPTLHIISGVGSCSQPLAPAAGSSGSLTVSAFKFLVQLLPP